MADRGENVQKRALTGVEPELACVAIAVDVFAVHNFPDEVRQAARRDAGIDETGDVGVPDGGGVHGIIALSPGGNVPM